MRRKKEFKAEIYINGRPDLGKMPQDLLKAFAACIKEEVDKSMTEKNRLLKSVIKDDIIIIQGGGKK